MTYKYVYACYYVTSINIYFKKIINIFIITINNIINIRHETLCKSNSFLFFDHINKNIYFEYLNYRCI